MPKTSAKRKPLMSPARAPEPTPTLVERATTLLEAVIAAPPEVQREVLAAFRDGLDDHLDRLAEATRPVSIPQGYVRMQMDAKGWGTCHCQALREAMKQ
jgi:hypothetical protein